MLTVTPGDIEAALLPLIPQLATRVPDDILSGLVAARETETGARARIVLDQLVQNACVAADDCVPICQDTGTVWVCLEAGPDVLVPGNVFSRVNDAVAKSYIDARLRKSVVKDALFDRGNTQDNTPAFCEVHFVDEPGVCRLHVMLKGGGSDKVGGLAKRALMRPLGTVNPDPDAAAFEAELLSAINATGIGAGALGGQTTALGVRVSTAPCHIAALPVAVNMSCSATRRATVDIPTHVVKVSEAEGE